VSYPYPAYPTQPHQHRSLRKLSIFTVILIGLSVVSSVAQVAIAWSVYDDIKSAVYGLSSDAELQRSLQALNQFGPLWDLTGYVIFGSGALFLVWLWQARERTVALDPAAAAQTWPRPGLPRGPHRLDQGWVIGSWFCPIVQFWYPLRVVQDVVTASEPPAVPGMIRSHSSRGLLYGWWAAWVGYWVVVIGGGGAAVTMAVVRVVQLVDDVEQAEAASRDIEVYALQDFMVRLTLALEIGLSVAAGLLLIAGVLISVLVLRVSGALDKRQPVQLPTGPTVPVHPQQAGAGHLPQRPVDSPYPSYGPHSQQPGSYGRPTQAPPPWQPPPH
jgi:hypothetical protein